MEHNGKICETAVWYNAINKEFLINFKNKIETAARFTFRSMFLSSKVIWSLTCARTRLHASYQVHKSFHWSLLICLHTSLNVLQDQGKNTQHLAELNPKVVMCLSNTCDGQVTMLRKNRNKELLYNSKSLIWGYFHLFSYKQFQGLPDFYFMVCKDHL